MGSKVIQIPPTKQLNKRCSISEFQFGRNKNTLEEVCFNMKGRSLNHKSLVRDVGLMIDESLNWTEHVKVRVGKAAKSFFLLRRSTSPIICTQSKAHLYRTNITASVLFASECWELRKTSFKIIETFNKKVLQCICGNLDFKDALVQSNLLPPLYFKVLKDLSLFSNILEGRYNVDFSKEFKITNSGRRRRVVLQNTRYEIQRQNVWYRTGFRINVVQRSLDFFNPRISRRNYLNICGCILTNITLKTIPKLGYLFAYVWTVVPILDCNSGVKFRSGISTKPY